MWSVASLAPAAKSGTIRDRFSYLRPEIPLRSAGRSDLADLPHGIRPTPAIVDGITAAMAMHSLDLTKPLCLVWLWV